MTISVPYRPAPSRSRFAVACGHSILSGNSGLKLRTATVRERVYLFDYQQKNPLT